MTKNYSGACKALKNADGFCRQRKKRSKPKEKESEFKLLPNANVICRKRKKYEHAFTMEEKKKPEEGERRKNYRDKMVKGASSDKCVI